MPTAVVGRSSRTSTVLSTTTPRLLGQRANRGTGRTRLGASNSHTAISANTPAKASIRIIGSRLTSVSAMVWLLSGLRDCRVSKKTLMRSMHPR